MTIVRNRGSTSSQVGAGQNLIGTGASSSVLSTSNVDTLQDQQITITGLLTNVSEVITLEGYTVEVLPYA
jgi:hypothetical protein